MNVLNGTIYTIILYNYVTTRTYWTDLYMTALLNNNYEHQCRTIGLYYITTLSIYYTTT